ncbi:DUF1284 domain-containing protein [Paenibacillus sp. GCM10012307]|uniref:DUF1284 domain-containing protein n=1 Tax=Paenibacillus roseus TaxID=2798579 RepID=A0A934MRA2_9BACL|nr:DUF1284 domain-containing protein [Paenibacillus roseus]MBJ6364046.1 DUF1284 domain-containing protein [Paenibacillus roseus]
MAVLLRGHHVLCLLGYRGKGYSDDFCTNMTAIYETLRTKPDTVIEIIEGPDDICRAFPPDQPHHCRNQSVYQKDNEILQAVGIEQGRIMTWAEVVQAASRVEPDDIRTLCSNCEWEPLGLCREGVRHIRQAGVLRELP